MKNPIVSICCQTYNHKEYIKEAIESFLMQETDFAYEILLRDDASTDGTQEIVKEYSDRFPNIIRPLIYSVNQYQKGGKPFLDNVKRAKGKYIAICEGDDYWTDPLKLQKQVDFLEANAAYTICFHRVEIWKEENQELVNDWITREVPETTTILDLVKGNYIHTPSLLFKNVFREDLSTIVSAESPMGDYPLLLHLAQYGKIKKLDEVMAVYRYGVGIWSGQRKIQIQINNFRCFGTLLGSFNSIEINGLIEEKYFKIGFFLYRKLINECESEKAKEIFIEICKNIPEYFCTHLGYGLLFKSSLLIYLARFKERLKNYS